jgi:hypothetical protein
MASKTAVNNFGNLLNPINKISDGVYFVTTAKRITLTPPAGVRLYDSDLSRWYEGDGSTNGGILEGVKRSVRKIGIGAASGTTTINSGTDVFTDTKIANLRTGDGLTFAAGTGTLPSGVSATQYYITKVGDDGSGDANTGTTFKIATTRANAIAGTNVDVLSSGAAGWTTVVATVCVNENDDVVLIDPVSAAVSVVLPDANTATGFGCTIKRAKTATNAVTIKELDASGNVAASGAVIIDDTAGYVTLKAATDDYITVIAESSAGEYWSISDQITA